MLPTARPAARPKSVNSNRVKPDRAHSSRLVRLLASISAAQGAPVKLPFAERLGQWLGWADAISLCALLESGDAALGKAAPTLPGVAVDRGTSPAAALARLQRELAQAIASDAVFDTDARPTDFQPYRRSHAAHQRTMAARVGALREQVRATLAQHSADLRQLADLDRLMDGVVGAQQRSSLSALSGWLESRFEKLRALPAGALAVNEGDSDAHSGGEWRAAFGHEMQALLLAELELRLQPVLGLIEALDREKTS